MDFLKTVRQRSVVSDIVYIALNLGLALAVFLSVWALGSPLVAILVVLLSKWRVLAVRPRYWMANIQANMVDIIVSLSFVGLLYFAGSVTAQIGITLLYAAWLFFLKPRSKRPYMVAQAHIAGLVGITMLFSISYAWPASLVVILMWLIGYSTARHVLSAYEEKQATFVSLVWAVIIAQLGWLAHHWTIAYVLPSMADSSVRGAYGVALSNMEGIAIPQVAITVFFLGFLSERMYASIAKNGTVKFGDVILPALLSVSVIIILQLVFNSVGTGAI